MAVEFWKGVTYRAMLGSEDVCTVMLSFRLFPLGCKISRSGGGQCKRGGKLEKIISVSAI